MAGNRPRSLLGLRVLLLSSDPAYYNQWGPNALREAHDIVRCDTSDVGAMTKALQPYDVIGVVAMSDMSLLAANEVAIKLGCPAVDPCALKIARHK
jgi:hypothetical protein